MVLRERESITIFTCDGFRRDDREDENPKITTGRYGEIESETCTLWKPVQYQISVTGFKDRRLRRNIWRPDYRLDQIIPVNIKVRVSRHNEGSRTLNGGTVGDINGLTTDPTIPAPMKSYVSSVSYLFSSCTRSPISDKDEVFLSSIFTLRI